MKIDITPKFIDEAATPLAKSVGKTLDSLWSLVFEGFDFYVEKVNTKRTHSLQLFKEELEKKVSSIPEENLVEPPLHIIGPTIEASKFYFESDELRSMFSNLIAASIDSETINKTHPAFVDCIKQLSPLDAKNLRLFKNKSSILPIAKYKLLKEDGSGVTVQDNVFLSNEEVQNIDLNSASLTNLSRLGLVQITYDTSLTDINAYAQFDNEPIFKDLKYTYEKGEHRKFQNLSIFDKVQLKKGIIELTPFGSNFIDICI
ncbi:DUF4393 domain-containing protein [Bacillus haynesii]|uniref:DUF4393 domain-containing protein n=1 Tax=Bacillus haynesii TaxID=1925021 RepID=UPI0022802262|nr:DUF4393 domain-containing protein [Bacillus haynesii]MCY7800785.1 DUF4393 domain-containing protein [Bacillus haynesii]